MFLAIIVISVISILLFVRSAVPKVRRQASVAATAEHLDSPVRLMHVVGVLEVLGAAGLALGLVYAPIGMAAAAGLVLLMLGATIAHLGARDPVKLAVVPLIIATLPGVLLVLHVANG